MIRAAGALLEYKPVVRQVLPIRRDFNVLRWCGTVARTLRRHYRWLPLIVILLGVSGAAMAHFYAQKQYDEAKQALAEARLDEAFRHVNQCMRIWRRSPSAHLLAARIQRCRGHYEEAEAHLEEAPAA